MRVFCGRLLNFVCPSFPFGIEGRMLAVFVLIPDHCLSIYFVLKKLLTYFEMLIVPTALHRVFLYFVLML